MRTAKFLLILLVSIPILTMGQFGPRKKMLKANIDTLSLINSNQQILLNYLRLRDSTTLSDVKRLTNELKDLKLYTKDLTTKIENLSSEHENSSKEYLKLKKQYDELIKKVEIHQILIRNVIGGDSLEEFEKQIEKENKPKTGAIEGQKNFKAFATEFISTLKREGEMGLKSYINPKKSFYYLSKPGFIVSVSEIKNANDLADEIPWRTGYDAFKKSKFSLIEGEKPEINCDMADFYNKRGCYGGIEQDFDKVSKSLLALKEFSPDEDLKINSQINEIIKLENKVVSFIYSTDGNLGFYFIKTDGGWQLYCLEIEDPCSA